MAEICSCYSNTYKVNRLIGKPWLHALHLTTWLLLVPCSFHVLYKATTATESGLSCFPEVKHATYYLHVPQEGVGRHGAWKRLVITLTAFLRLAPVGLWTIYTGAGEALHCPKGRIYLLDHYMLWLHKFTMKIVLTRDKPDSNLHALWVREQRIHQKLLNREAHCHCSCCRN